VLDRVCPREQRRIVKTPSAGALRGRYSDSARSETSTRGAVSFFDDQADRWEDLYRSRAAFRDRLSLFSEALASRVPPPGRILDLGCGPGVMSLSFAAQGYRVIGVDAAPRMIERAEGERRQHNMDRVHFSVMDATRPGFARESFDAVVCSSVIEYIPDDVALLQQIAVLLRPGGWVLVSVPHSASVLALAEDATARLSRFRHSPGRGHLVYSRRRYRNRDLIRQLALLGFGEIALRYYEVPLLGALAVPLSRLPIFGLMMLVIARREPAAVVKLQESPQWRSTVRRRAWSRKNLWEATPTVIRRWVGRSLHGIAPSTLLGAQFRRTVRFARHVDRWPVERVAEFQLHRLRQVLSWAYARSPYYRAVFDSAGLAPDGLRHVDDLRCLPFLTREAVEFNLSDMACVPLDSRRVELVSTGGVSGTPLHFFIGVDRSATEFAYLLASWERSGYRLGMALAAFRGRIVGHTCNNVHVDVDPILRHYHYSTFHLTDRNVGDYLEHISGIGPCYLHIYPSTGAILARYISSQGLTVPANIRGIIAESENVYPEQRAFIERVFGVRMFSCYGHTEKLILASECETSTAYHIWPTYGYCEIIDECGNAVATPGQRGELVGTGFINRAVPFIRYRTGDYATYVDHVCRRCGRPHLIVSDIRGHRVQEVLIASDGSQIPWTAVNMHDDTFMRVRQFQFRQDRPGHAVLRVVPSAGFNDADAQRISDRIALKLGDRISIEIELTDMIPTSPTGKAIYVDQRVPAAAPEAAPGLSEASLADALPAV